MSVASAVTAAPVVQRSKVDPPAGLTLTDLAELLRAAVADLRARVDALSPVLRANRRDVSAEAPPGSVTRR